MELELLLDQLGISREIRLRDLELMTDQKTVSDQELQTLLYNCNLLQANNILNYNHNGYCSWSKRYRHKAIKYDNMWSYPISYDLSKVHGKLKKRLKLQFKHTKKKLDLQYDLFNQFVGKKVLYVCTRLGNYNWCRSYRDEYLKMIHHPKFLGMAEDTFDCTYCEFYFDVSHLI